MLRGKRSWRKVRVPHLCVSRTTSYTSRWRAEKVPFTGHVRVTSLAYLPSRRRFKSAPTTPLTA